MCALYNTLTNYVCESGMFAGHLKVSSNQQLQP